MRLEPTGFVGAHVIHFDAFTDERGHFSRIYCAHEFAAHGLDPAIAQIGTSFNRKRGTLRGLHFQKPPFQETKTVRCLHGAVFDVIVDLRKNSPTYLRWFGTELSSSLANALHIPAQFAHGFVSLEDNTIMEYLISHAYVPSAARGIRYDDPTLKIDWPMDPVVINERDRAYPPLLEVLNA